MVNEKLAELIALETKRQQNTLCMIPSENYSSTGVREAVGSVLMHKYSEGYPGKRYYEGNEYIDQIELMAIELAKEVFKLPGDWEVNVQPLAGSNANLAVYNALLQPGDSIMGMYLYDGGHLSHGWQWKGNKVNITSKIYNSHFYHVNADSELLNYDEIAKIADEVKPKLIVSGGTAYPREIDHTKMSAIAHKVGAYYLADVAHEAGLIAGGMYPSPIGIADVVTMTTHKTLRGPKGAMILGKAELMELINRSVFPGMQGGPHNGTIAGIAQALTEAATDEFRTYTKNVITDAQTLAQHFAASGYHVISGGTSKHLVLVDSQSKGIDGQKFARALSFAGIIVNKNTIPNDTRTPNSPSGIRLGTPFIATRGVVGAENMKRIFEWIEQVREIVVADSEMPFSEFSKKYENDEKLMSIAQEVTAFLDSYPLPQ